MYDRKGKAVSTIKQKKSTEHFEDIDEISP